MKAKYLLLIIGLINAAICFKLYTIIGLHYDMSLALIVNWVSFIGITFVFVNAK
jgi:hypothetical protein